MERSLVEDLLHTVNDPGDMRALVRYAEYRLSELYKTIPHIADQQRLGYLQGSIAELQKLSGLRDTVLGWRKAHENA